MERAEEEAKKRRKEERKRLARQRKEERAQRRRMKAFRKRQKGGTGSFVRHAAPPSDTHGDNGDSGFGGGSMPRNINSASRIRRTCRRVRNPRT